MSGTQSPEVKEGGFVPSGFFAFRTPLLPFDEFLAWCEGLEAEAALGEPGRLEQALATDRKRLRDRLRDLIVRPRVRDAIFIASPDLDESLDVWVREPESERGRRIERAIVRYFARMTGRATPFGLFAGTSVGTIGSQTRLILEGREKYRRRSRLDMDYLFALTQAVGRDPALRRGIPLRPNSSLYRAAGRVHYVEARLDGKNRTHHLVAAEDSDELRATLARVAEGADAGALIDALVGGDVSREEAEQYVQELVDSQILVPDLSLFLTGPDPVGALHAQLSRRPETAAIGDRLKAVRTEISAIDAEGAGVDPARYRAIAKACGDLPSPVELSRLFQVDMFKSSPAATLGGAVLDEIVRGVEILRKLAAPRGADDLTRFREAFVARYEEREVPLAEALDEEVGIGFPHESAAGADGGPLLKGLAFPEAFEETSRWGAWERFLLAKLEDAAALGATEITLEKVELDRFERKEPVSLPNAFAVAATVAAANDEAVSRGDFRVCWTGFDGPSGARLLGRFCDADSQLLGFVQRHLRDEEALDPEAIFAEVVHLPEGRLGNILFRPVLRGHEIPYLGSSGASADRQIPITDLLVSVSGRRIVLKSARLARRVIPRLTSAHNYRFMGLPLYRFLCELQAQDLSGFLGWDWGPLATAPFLPRVSCGRLVLSLARWSVPAEELKSLGQSHGTERFLNLQSWRAKRRLPRIVLLAEADNLLPVDLTNVLSVESFVHLVKDRSEARLIEMFPGPEELCARGPEGCYVHELIVPFVRTPSVAADVPSILAVNERKSPTRKAERRRFTPGSEWLYVKLYAGTATMDNLLRETVAPLVRKSLRSGAAGRWFFIRYGDPEHHLRLRLHGRPVRLLQEVLPGLQRAVAPLLADGRIWKVQLDTYEREVERYGGSEGIELAERVFQADSEAVLAIVERLEPGDAGADERWRLALYGIHSLLEDCEIDFEARRALMGRLRDEFAKEMHANDELRHELGNRFRKESHGLERLLYSEKDGENPLAPGIAALQGRSRVLAPLIRKIKIHEREDRLSRPIADIASSYIHMHVNRMLRSAQRAQEFVLYDFLSRLYQSRAARSAREPKT
jgi:class I lanthipeptide synthase